MTTRITDSNRAEGNRLIAEFMGYTVTKFGFSKTGSYVDEQGSRHETGMTIKTVKYHESWDWLMPVVEKISKIQCDEPNKDRDTYYLRAFGMPSEEGEFMVRFNRMGLHFSNNLIEAAYQAVVQFIHHYNQQQ